MTNGTPMYLIPPVPPEEGGTEAVGGYGHISAKYMIVIPEAPMTTQGLHPTTPKQMTFFRNVVNAHLKGGCYITPLVKYRRPATAKTLYIKDIRYFLPVLFREIELVRPERILLMGKFVSKALIPHFKAMGADHGCLFTTKGEELDQSLSHLEDMVLVPTFSFQDCIRDPMARDYFHRDIQRFAYTEVTKSEWQVIDNISQIPIGNRDRVTIDTETTGLDLNSHIHMIGVQTSYGLYIAHDPKPEDLTGLFNVINATDSTAVFHNLPFDVAQMTTSSEHSLPQLKNRPKDTMIMAHLVGEKIRNLKHLTTMYTDLPGPHSGGSYQDEAYLAEDVRSTDALVDTKQLNMVTGTYADELYHDLATIFVPMRLRGVYMDRELLIDQHMVAGQKREILLGKLKGVIGDINLNSPAQVSKALIELGIPLSEKTDSGNLSVAEGVIEVLIDELKTQSGYEDQIHILSTLLEYRATEKLVSGFLNSYLDLLDNDNLLYPNLKIDGTATGRLSCANPNLQQVGRVFEIKKAFKARWPNSYYGLVDFSGAELKMAAIVSGDRQMAEFINSGDPHSYMARLAFPDIIPQDTPAKIIKNEYAKYRKASKSTTFAQMYGGTINGIAKKNGLPVENVQAVDSALRKHCPELMNWIERTKAESLRTLQSSTLFGNIRSLKDKLVYEGEWAVKNSAINMPAQGGAGILALVVLRKLYQLCEEYNTLSRPIFSVHDSIVSEIHHTELKLYPKLVQEAYRDIENSPIVDYPVYHIIGITGDLDVAEHWAGTESTSPWHNVLYSYECDSRG